MATMEERLKKLTAQVAAKKEKEDLKKQIKASQDKLRKLTSKK